MPSSDNPEKKTAEIVAINKESNGKLLGGCTGKGFMPGKSGNPAGRPKRDEASILAQRIFEANPEEIVAAFALKLLKGDPYAFQVLADRAYGKMPQTSIVTGDLDVNLSAKRSRLAEVLALLGDAS